MRSKFFSRFGFFGLILLLGVQSVYAQTYTLNQVYSLALQKSEEVQIAREEISRSEQEKRRALSAVLPKVTLSGTYERSPEERAGFGIIQPEESYGMEAKVEQPLYSGGKNQAGMRIAQEGVVVTQKSYNLSSESLLLRVAQAFYGMLKAQKDLEAQQRNVERLREHRRLSELRYKVGEVTEAVLLRAEAELANAQAELVTAGNELAVRRQELQILAELPESFEVQEPPLPEIPTGTDGALINLALKNREDILRSQAQERIARDRVAFARGNFMPSLSLEGTYFNRDQEPRSTFFIKDSWSVVGRIDFPIFEGGLRLAELRQARSVLEQSRFEAIRLKKQIDLEVTRASLSLAAVAKALQSRKEQHRFATKNYEIVSKQFTFGLVTHIDLLDANQALIEAERDVITATYDQHLAILELQRSVGVFLPKVLEQIQASL